MIFCPTGSLFAVQFPSEFTNWIFLCAYCYVDHRFCCTKRQNFIIGSKFFRFLLDESLIFMYNIYSV